jgi:hypothetical protein
MTRFILAALVAATPLWAQAEKPADPAPAKTENSFSAADTNRDGVLTMDELKTHRSERLTAIRRSGESDDPRKSLDEVNTKYDKMITIDQFLRYDEDDDNRLTRAEFDELQGGDLPAFTQRDSETLGDLTFDEWRTFASARGDEFKVSAFSDRMALSRKALRTRSGDDLKKRYALNRANSNFGDFRDIVGADADSNGVVTRAEAREYWRKSYNGEFGQLNDQQNKLLGEARFNERTAALDSNDDGILTRDEINNAWDAPDDDSWKKLDANGDGKLDRDEVTGWEMDSETRSNNSQPKKVDSTPDKPDTADTPKKEGQTPKDSGQTPKAPGK